MAELEYNRMITIEAIEAAVEAKEAQERDFDKVIRGHSIGKPCERYGWYKFRWIAPPEAFEGRMLRLFNTGHVEEDRMIEWLRMTGCEVVNQTGEGGQIRVEALDGHMAGHLDGEVLGLKEAPKTWHLLECKTHNDKSFAQLVKFGVKIAKPEHVAQMQLYMGLRGLTRGFYLAKNKNTDELYSDRIEFDAAHFAALMAKGERILASDKPLDKISDDPNNFQCRFCHLSGVCHNQAQPLRNCRTCIHSETRPGCVWYCERHEMELSHEAQKEGCTLHRYLPGLIHGELIGADAESETMTYKLDNGEEWIDG